jgi:hypothetical protein
VDCGILESGQRAAATNEGSRYRAEERDGGNEKRREVDVMMRERGHVVLGVCSPFEDAGGLISEFLCCLSKDSRAGKVCRAQTLK